MGRQSRTEIDVPGLIATVRYDLVAEVHLQCIRDEELVHYMFCCPILSLCPGEYLMIFRASCKSNVKIP